MHSLFFKIFISFILMIVLAGFTTLTISYWTPYGPYGAVETQNANHSADTSVGNKKKKRGLLPIVVITLLAVPGCYMLARSLTAPIRDLREATQRITRGDFSARVDLFGSRNDEIADLGRDFNTMAKRTQSLLDSQKRLLRDISHELRSPLTRLHVALDLAKRQPDDVELHLARIEKEATRFDELITHLLTLAKKESQLDNIPRQPVSLRKLLGDIVHNAEFEASSRDRGIEIEKFDDIVLSGSREMLSRALENVIRNGLHYTPSGSSIEIHVSKLNDQVAVSVRDHGPGVPQDQLSQIFKAFFRVTEARDRKSGGTGIGLAIAKQAIIMHGGTIEARNGEEDGLIINITLPLS